MGCSHGVAGRVGAVRVGRVRHRLDQPGAPRRVRVEVDLGFEVNVARMVRA